VGCYSLDHFFILKWHNNFSAYLWVTRHGYGYGLGKGTKKLTHEETRTHAMGMGFGGYEYGYGRKYPWVTHAFHYNQQIVVPGIYI
jgi:hypothetical protein